MNEQAIEIGTVNANDDSGRVALRWDPESGQIEAVTPEGKIERTEHRAGTLRAAVETARALWGKSAAWDLVVNVDGVAKAYASIQTAFGEWKATERRAAGNRGGGYDSDSQREAVKAAARAYVAACYAVGELPMPSAIDRAK